LPADVGQHSSRSRREEAAVGDLEDAVDEVTAHAPRAAVHTNGEDRAAAGARADLHPPRAARLRRARLLDGRRDDRLVPFVALDRPDAEAGRALADARPAVAALEHRERFR